jgi:hypothetical protein
LTERGTALISSAALRTGARDAFGHAVLFSKRYDTSVEAAVAGRHEPPRSFERHCFLSELALAGPLSACAVDRPIALPACSEALWARSRSPQP